MKTIMDERWRITLGKKIGEKYGKEFAVVETENRIMLIPISKEPIGELQKMWRDTDIDKYSIKKLKQMAREEAEKEIQQKLERLERVRKNVRR